MLLAPEQIHMVDMMLDEIRSEKLRYAFYGTGKICLELMSAVKKHKITPPICIVDHLTGHFKIEDIEVKNLTQITGSEFDCLILASNSFQKEMRANIGDRIPESKIIDFTQYKSTPHKCYACNTKLRNFTPYPISDYHRSYCNFLDTVGSSIEYYSCPVCGSIDRERHLMLYFDRLELWGKFKNANVLHIAPGERRLVDRIDKSGSNKYIKADLSPENYNCNAIKMDIENINLADKSIDIIICNHVLEHVSNYKKALSELHRVMTRGAFAILQTPYANNLHKHFEDPGLNTDELRTAFYGQADHLRFFAKKALLADFSELFNLNIIKNEDLFTNAETIYYGINAKEDLIICEKI